MHTDGGAVRRVTRFVEKPDLKTAKSFVTQGNFVWNARIFVARADVLLDEMRLLCPVIAEHAEAAVVKAKSNGLR